MYRHDDGGVLFALCGPAPKPARGTCPKGPRTTARPWSKQRCGRVREETGLEVEIEAPLGEIEYWFTRSSRRIHKRVHFYLMGERGGSFADHDAEFDVVEWFPALQAVRTLTFPTEAGIARHALSKLSAGESEEHAAAGGEGDRG